MSVRLRLTLALSGFAIALLVAGIIIALRYTAPRRTQRATVVTNIYTVCGHKRLGANPNPSMLDRLAGDITGARFGDWRIVSADRRELHLAYEIRELCPSCKRARFLGISDGFVAVFSGTPAHRGEPVEITGIPAEALPQREMADLKRGIAFSGDKERLQLLEGLAALTDA